METCTVRFLFISGRTRCSSTARTGTPKTAANRRHALPLSLVNPHPVNLVADGKSRMCRVAAGGANGLVQNQVNRLVKWIAPVRFVRSGKVEVVHQLAVEKEINSLFVPIHRPSVKRFGPGVAAEFNDGLLHGGPFDFAVETVGDVGQDSARVKLHDVDLAAGGPTDAG